MNEFADSIKKNLDTILTQMNEYSWMFVNNPQKDFTRKRKLDFKEMLNILLSMGSSTLKLELMKYFSYDVELLPAQHLSNNEKRFCQKHLSLFFINLHHLPLILVTIMVIEC